MVLGIVKPILSPLLNPASSAATPAAPAPAVAAPPTVTPAATPVAQASAAAQQPAEAPPTQQSAAPAQTEGFKFDLSDKALHLVEAAASVQSAAPLSSAVQAVTGPSTSSTSPAARPATGSTTASVEAPAPAPVAAEAAAEQPAQADPTEEEHARAWAVRGMEREKLLNLVDIMKVTPKVDLAQKAAAEHAAAQPSIQIARSVQEGAA
ncbi:hypothetical protein [uncultured Paracoccus sp.]|uniref:hypothetical protein n=1 Tax=uncultured Paracoccus sp. TaxID=189685 RepID=UPI0025E287BA|nr:hypothetical protein [uncultured Paracoccus sp.]